MTPEEHQPKLVELSGEDLKKLRQGPIQHAGLDPFLTAWARRLFHRVGHHVYPSFEQWELGFLRDMRPDRELFVWEAIARAYEAYLADHPACDKAKLTNDLTLLSMGGRFNSETAETAAMTAVFDSVWNQMTADPQAVLEQVRASLEDANNS